MASVIDEKAAHEAEPDHQQSDSHSEKPVIAKPVVMADSARHQTGMKLVFLLMSCFLCLFLVSLDRTIITTAIPRITDEFDSLTDVGWYGSAYMLTAASLQLIMGKVYTFFPIKNSLLMCILIFAVGSALCGAAPNSPALIVGRAIAGIASAGIFAGVIVCVVYGIPLAKRPKVQAAIGAVFGLAQILGPLIGGGLTSHASWRWCFYINLPCCAVALFTVFFSLEEPKREAVNLPWPKKLAQLDGPGTAALIPGVVCLLLALQWGGSTYKWSNGREIALLTLGCTLIVTFCIIQVLRPKTATVPPRILKQRSIAGSFWAILCVGGSQFIFIYFLPLWFQTIKGVSAIQSGIRLIPLMLGIVVASIITGICVQRLGYYTPFAIVGSFIFAIGAGLLTTLEVNSSSARWIGLQVLYGLGTGFTFQTPTLAAQTVLPTVDVPIGTALMFFGQLLGGAIIVSVGQNVLDTQLVKRLTLVIPNFDPQVVTSGGATEILAMIPDDLRPSVLTAYNESLRRVFQVGAILSCLAVLGTVALEWRSTKEKKDQYGNQVKSAPVEAEAAATAPDEEAAIEMKPASPTASDAVVTQKASHDSVCTDQEAGNV